MKKAWWIMKILGVFGTTFLIASCHFLKSDAVFQQGNTRSVEYILEGIDSPDTLVSWKSEHQFPVKMIFKDFHPRNERLLGVIWIPMTPENYPPERSIECNYSIRFEIKGSVGDSVFTMATEKPKYRGIEVPKSTPPKSPLHKILDKLLLFKLGHIYVQISTSRIRIKGPKGELWLAQKS